MFESTSLRFVNKTTGSDRIATSEYKRFRRRLVGYYREDRRSKYVRDIRSIFYSAKIFVGTILDLLWKQSVEHRYCKNTRYAHKNNSRPKEERFQSNRYLSFRRI